MILELTDQTAPAYAGFVYLIAMYLIGPTMAELFGYVPKNKRGRKGRHVRTGVYAPRWGTPSVPRHRALTEAPPARYLPAYDTAQIKVCPSPSSDALRVQMVGRTVRPRPGTNAAFVAEIMGEHIR